VYDGVVDTGFYGRFGLLGQPPGSASLVVTHAWLSPPQAAGDSPPFSLDYTRLNIAARRPG